MKQGKKQHWEHIYATKNQDELSWYQAFPHTSVRLIEASGVAKDAPIIDIGGGDSLLVDALLERGYTQLYVLDISAHAIERAKQRLGHQAQQVHWIVDDVVTFKPDLSFELWHDRATFHFLTEDILVEKYRQLLSQHVSPEGHFILGTFSMHGPQRCSGLEVRRYSETSMENLFSRDFRKVRCFEEVHDTPFHTHQFFEFCWFTRLSSVRTLSR